MCSEILISSFIQGLISFLRLNDNNVNDNSNLLLCIPTTSYWRNSRFGYYRLLEQELCERAAISHIFTSVKPAAILQISPETPGLTSSLTLNFSVSFIEKFHTLTQITSLPQSYAVFHIGYLLFIRNKQTKILEISKTIFHWWLFFGTILSGFYGYSPVYTGN